VSHDRAFLDNVVTQTIAFEGDGHWLEYAGGYSDWQRVKAGMVRDAAAKARDELKPVVAEAPAKKRPKMGFKETRELEALPGKMEALEAEQKAIVAKLADPSTYADRTVDVKALNQRNEAIDAELTTLLARWELLESRK
jgi:ATP-binding cassette subfamily F protein uup